MHEEIKEHSEYLRLLGTTTTTAASSGRLRLCLIISPRPGVSSSSLKNQNPPFQIQPSSSDFEDEVGQEGPQYQMT